MNFVRARRTAGLSLMLSSLVVGLLMAPAAIAAEGDPENLPEEMTLVEENTREGFWSGDPSDYGNNAVTKEYPPEAVCLVQPQFCSFPEGDGDPSGDLQLGGELNKKNDEINKNYQDTTGTAQEGDPGPPEDPVPPDTLPVSVAFGQNNYRSAVEFPLPDVPAGDQVDSFQLFLVQSNPTYHNSSPALRQAVLAGLTCARGCSEEEFEKVAMENCDEELSETPDPCFREDDPLLVEMCPIVDSEETAVNDLEWESGRSHDEETLPAVNCIFGDLGTIYSGVEVTGADGETETVTLWGFDLTLALNAWNEADIPYAGVQMRPGSAANFAYGDPETTYSKQVTFRNTVRYALETSEPPPPPPTFDPNSFGGSSGATGTSTGGSSGGDLFGTPPTPASNSPISDTGVTPQPTGSGETPAVAEQPPAEEQASEPVEALAANAPLGQPETPWWLWLLVLPFLAGAWLLQQSMTAPVQVATRRSGAMTRLLQRQAAERAPDLVTG